jgi:peptidase C39-like protein
MRMPLHSHLGRVARQGRVGQGPYNMQTMKRLMTISAMAGLAYVLFAGINHAAAAYLTGALPDDSSVLLPVPPAQQLRSTSCGEAAIVMAHNYAQPESPLDEASVIEYAESAGYYTPELAPFTSPADMVRIVQNYGDGYSTGDVIQQDQGLALLLLNLEGGNPVIVDVLTHFNDPSASAHFVLVTGISLGPGDSVTVFYNDPLTGRGEASPWEGDDGLWHAWQHNGDPGGAGWFLVITH